MVKKYLFSAVIAFVSCTGAVLALGESAPEVASSVMVPMASPTNEALKVKLAASLGIKVASVKHSPMPGMVEVITDQGLFYASADGKFLLQGKMYGLGKTIINLTEASLAQVRIDGMDKFKNDMIVFAAKDEKHVVTVFTDITCGYCRKLHDQMADYNDKGITVRYLPYPRSGVKGRDGQYLKGFKDLRSIWCHEDPQTALTNAKAGANVAQRICDKPIEAEFNFGRQVGVNGTPAIMLANGMMVPGYQDPEKLFMILENAQQGG